MTPATDTILIVDDNPSNLKLASFVLVGVGYKVRTAMCAEDAMAELRASLPRLILLDIQLPDTDGLTLARLIRQMPAMSRIPIIAVTAYAMKGDEEAARAVGIDAYVTKPINTASLRGLVAEFMRRTEPSPNGESENERGDDDDGR